MASCKQQKRLLFKLPLDKLHTKIHPDPSQPSSSLLVQTDQGDLYYTSLTGRQLKFVRNNVQSVLWLTSHRFLILDATNHDLIFYKIDAPSPLAQTGNADLPVQFVSVLHFAFQFIASILLEFGLTLKPSDELLFLTYLPRTGFLDLLVRKEYFLRLLVDGKKRLFTVVLCLRLGKALVGSASADLTLVLQPEQRKVFLISALENEFLVSISLKEYLPTRVWPDPVLVDFSPDFRWLIAVTATLDVFQVYLPVFQASSWSHLHKTSLYAASSRLRFQDDDAAPDNRKALRRVNTVWEREFNDVVAKNNAKQHFTPNGWIFPEDDSDDSGQRTHVRVFRPPAQFEQFSPTAVHCTESEIYLTSRNHEGCLLLGVKPLAGEEAVWLTFPQECLITFPLDSSYPVMLFYPMSMAIIAHDSQSGFQRSIAEAAAPDPWEDLTENEVMELALTQGIQDKALDYLQRRFPERTDLFRSDYPVLVARAIAREHLQERNINAARDILKLVSLEVTGEMQGVFAATDDARYRLWLRDSLRDLKALSESFSHLFEYLTLLEAHLDAPLSIFTVESWSEAIRQERLLKAGIDKRDLQLTAAFSPGFIWDVLVAGDEEERILAWIRGDADFTVQPVDTSFCERINMSMQSEFAELIRNEFARKNVFSSHEASDWRLFVLRLMSAFGEHHPFFQRDNLNRLDALPVNLQRQFLEFCVEHRLVPVIMDVADQSSFTDFLDSLQDESLPDWLDLLLLFRKTHLDHLEGLKALSVKNAEFCWQNDASIQRLLQLEETEVVLALLCLFQPQWPPVETLFDGSQSSDCIGLLQKQLSKLPKLQESLFPLPLPEVDRLAKNVSVYRLLAARSVYDARKLFGWQTSNTINSLYRAVEMPSFSTLDMQEKYGYKKELDFSYYLKNARPSFAYWSFMAHLTQESYKEELMAGRDMAFFLAIFFYLDNTLVGACVAFLEMLGIESLSTRVAVESARRIHSHRVKVFASADSANLIRDIFIELFKYGPEVAGSVLEDLVTATSASVSSAGLYPASWDATGHWVLVNQFAQLFDLPMPLEYLAICASNNEWLNFLTYCELFQYPIATVTPLLDAFPHPHIRANLALILQHTRAVKHDGHNRRESADPGPVTRNIRSTLYSRIGVMASDRTTSSTSDEETVRVAKDVTSPRNRDLRPANMVETLCLAQKSLHPWRELLNAALEENSPVYAMIASGEPGVDRMACLAVNLLTALPEDDLTRYRTTEDLPAYLHDFHFTRRHIESLCRLHASRDQLPLVNTAFSLVAQDSIIEQCLTVATDISQREDRALLIQKLKKLMESIQRASQLKNEKTREEIEDFKWGLGFGVILWADLLVQLRDSNELEWRGVLQVFKDVGVHLSVGKVKVGLWYGEVVEKFLADVASLSQSVQVDASRLLELKSLLRDFQQSSLWRTETFRMEVWQSIFGRVHVELSEKQSTDELIDMLSAAVESSDSLVEKNVLATIIWKLDDSDEHLRAAWQAKIAFGRATPLPLEEWMSDALIGSGTPVADLQREILALGRAGLSFNRNGMDSNLDRHSGLEEHGVLDSVISFLVKQGNLFLAARLSSVFCTFHADLEAIRCALDLARGDVTVEGLPEWLVQQVQNPSRRGSVALLYHNGGGVGGDYEDNVVLWLRKIAAICSLGRDVVMAILDNYSFAQFLQVGFEDMLVFSTSQVLERLFASPSLEHLSLAKRCLLSFKANTSEVTAFISGYVIDMLRNGLAAPQADPKAVGDSIKPYLGVVIDLVSLGGHLTDAAVNLPFQTKSNLNLNLAVEILIAAHEVITKAGHLEGLARLLAACKTIAKSLVDAGDFHSLLRLLNGVGRYSELTFIFHLIKEADKMEMLFSRGVEKDPKLKNAILNYLRKFHADDGDTFEMLAAAYSMHREIGETFLGIAQDKMALFKHRPIVDTGETQTELKRIAQFLMDAANSFSRAECYSRTERCIEQARLVALQIVFLPTGLRLLSLNNPSGFVSTHTRFAEAFIYAQAYGISEEWADAVYLNYVLNGDISYLQDYLIKYEVTVTLVAEVAKKFKADPVKPPTAVIYMKKLLRQVNDIETTFKLANDLAINDLAMEILQIDGGVYLKDVMKI